MKHTVLPGIHHRSAARAKTTSKNVSLRIPKRKITIFTGVSGSGKSSIVFDTIATEAQRQLNENFSIFIRNFLPRYAQPDADAIENLSMAVIVDQKRLGGGSHSTVGTVTDIYGVLRLLFSRVGKPSAGQANRLFVQRSRRHVSRVQRHRPQARRRSRQVPRHVQIAQRRRDPGSRFFVELWKLQAYTSSGFFDNDKKLGKFTEEEMDLLLHGKDLKVQSSSSATNTINLTYHGIIEKINAIVHPAGHQNADRSARRKTVEPYLTMRPVLPVQRRAAQPGRARLQGQRPQHRPTLRDMEIDELIEFVAAIKDPMPRRSSTPWSNACSTLSISASNTLSLSRETDTLSGGESQRIKIVKHLSSSLVDVMYIFDEPSVGMHPRDVHRMNELLQKLRDKGNTVIVVEHDPDVIKVADHIVDVGPHAGTQGGTIVFEGTYQGLLKADTLTGRHSTQSLPIKIRVSQANWQAAGSQNAKRQQPAETSASISPRASSPSSPASRAREKAR